MFTWKEKALTLQKFLTMLGNYSSSQLISMLYFCYFLRFYWSGSHFLSNLHPFRNRSTCCLLNWVNSFARRPLREPL